MCVSGLLCKLVFNLLNYNYFDGKKKKKKKKKKPFGKLITCRPMYYVKATLVNNFLHTVAKQSAGRLVFYLQMINNNYPSYEISPVLIWCNF